MTSSLEQLNQKFRRLKVTRQGDVCYFSGGFGESEDLSKFSDLFVGAKNFDLSSLKSVSWAGIRKAKSVWLADSSIKLSKVRLDLFEQLVIFEPAEVLAQCGSVQTGRGHDPAYLELSSLASHMSPFSGSSSVLSDEVVATAFLLDALRAAGSDSPPHGSHPSKIPIGYTAFFTICLSACALNIESLVSSLVGSLYPASQVFQAALDSHGFTEHPADFGSAGMMEAGLIADLEKLISTAEELSSVSLNVRIEGFKTVSTEHEDLTRSDVFQHLAYMTHQKGVLKSIAGQLESAGAEMIARLMSFPSSAVLAKEFGWISSLEADSQTLGAILNNFKVVNVMAEGDPEVALEEIQSEIARIDTLVDKCMVELQQLDAIRQILEHRVSEHDQLQKSLSDAQDIGIGDDLPNFIAMFGGGLLDQCIRWLVTDLERVVFDALFPGENATRKGAMDSGEVTFF